MLGAELALRSRRVALIDRDQGQHLSRVFDFYPPPLPNLVLGDDRAAKVRIVDTAPEVNAARALSYVREADCLLVPVKGPEAGSVLALPLLRVARRGPRRSPAGLRADHVQARRGESRRWLDELHRLAARTDARVFPPIGDLASVAPVALDPVDADDRQHQMMPDARALLGFQQPRGYCLEEVAHGGHVRGRGVGDVDGRLDADERIVQT